MFQTEIPFVERDQMPGNNYNQPLLLAHEAGFSYAAAGTSGLTTALNAVIAGTMKNATINGAQMYCRSRIDYETAARASSGGKRAFRQALDVVIENMWESTKKRLEISLLYGQYSIGKVASITSSVITITTAEWAPGLWAGMENALIEGWTTGGGSGTHTQHGDTVGMPITKVDIDNRKITVTGDTTGAALAAGDFLYFRGARAGGGHNDMLGIHGILSFTSGTLFGIANADNFSLLVPSTLSAGSGPLTFQLVQKAVAQLVGRGLVDDVTLFVNPSTWKDLLTDEAALVRYTDFQGGEKGRGAESLRFFSQNGTIAIRACIYVKEGYAYMLSPKMWKRVGATDVTFRLPDRGDEFFLHVPDYAGYELRNMSNQAPFTKAPARSLIINNIVNN